MSLKIKTKKTFPFLVTRLKGLLTFIPRELLHWRRLGLGHLLAMLNFFAKVGRSLLICCISTFGDPISSLAIVQA